MAAKAEFAPKVGVESGEVYAHSLGGTRELGGLALRNSGIESSTVYLDNLEDFETAITENIATDQEFGDKLIIDTPKVRKIVDGKATSTDGRPIIDVVTTGAAASAEMAENDPFYLPQSVRDEGDVLFARAGDSLKVGQTMHAVSMDPKEQLVANKEKWENMGYRKGMAVQHIYHRLNEDTMLTWTTVIKHSDKSAVARIYREDHGVDIADDTHSDLWMRYTHISESTPEETSNIGKETIKRHSELLGLDIDYKSATDFVTENKDKIDLYFKMYMVDLAKALVSGKNTEVMSGLASNVLQASDDLSPEVVRGLMRVANKKSFDDEDARLMKVIVRYAAVEDLRKGLKTFLEGEALHEQPQKTVYETSGYTTGATTPSYPVTSEHQRITHDQMSRIMASNISIGVREDRAVGGCAPVKIGRKDPSRPENMDEKLRNDMFGEVDEEEFEKKDKYGSLKFNCPHCNEVNTREEGELLETCQKCEEDVRCGDNPEEIERDKKGAAILQFSTIRPKEKKRFWKNTLDA